MKTKMSVKRDILLVIFIILLVGCTSVTDADILAGTDVCRPPCWMDIQPGVTNIGEMIRILQKHEKSGEGTLTYLDSGIVRWQSANEKNVYVYKTDDGFVSKIELDLRQSSIHLDEIIVLFGEPSNLEIGKIRDGYFFVTIFYSEKGLAFVGSSNNMDVSETNIGFIIQPDVVIVSSLYFQPSDVTTMVNILYGIDAVPEALSNIHEWTGYGIYRE